MDDNLLGLRLQGIQGTLFLDTTKFASGYVFDLVFSFFEYFSGYDMCVILVVLG